MSVSLALILMCGVFVAVGVYLILERSLSRVILGLGCLSNGVNILFLIAGGRTGNPPFIGNGSPELWADPLVMAMMLTAIVITLATTGFLLAMAYRTWQLRDDDEVRDDVEDRAVAVRQQLEESSQRSEVGTDLQETSAEFRDETDTPAPRFGRLGRWNRRHPKRRRHRYVANPNATHGVDGSLGNGVNGANGRNAGRNGHPRGTGTAGRNGNAGGTRR